MTDQNMPSTGWAMHTRKGERHPVPLEAPVQVDFDDPRARRRCRARVLDISAGGLSFPTLDERAVLREGDLLRRAVIRSGKREIAGELTVTHVTEPSAGRRVCGAAFRPATDADRLELEGMIAAIAAESDSEECAGLCPESLQLSV